MNPEEYAEDLFFRFKEVNFQCDSYNKNSAILCCEILRDLYSRLDIKYHYYNETINEIKKLEI